MSAEIRFRADIDAAVMARDLDAWVFARGIYADWLVDNDRENEAERLLETSFPLEPSSDWPDAGAIAGLSDHQREQLGKALVRPLGVLVGSPGTGKTYTLAALVTHLCRKHGSSRIAICAPTGKAAVRCRQSLEAYCERQRLDLELPRPVTIHSLLEIARTGYDGHGWQFEYNGACPLPYQYVIADEVSMLGTELASNLLSACANSAHVLLVGDTGQLPPVGHGSPLRDMIRAGVPCGSLREIHRNAGAIVRACAAIRDGIPFEACERFDVENGANLLHIEARYPKDIVETLCGLLARMRGAESRFNPAVDVQVVCATNEKGDLSRKKLNAMLREIINDANRETEIAGNPFWVNDRVICLENGRYATASGGDSEYIANGEIGYVDEVGPRSVTLSFGGPSILIRPMEYELFDLAFAVTTHKMQGSQAPVIIAVVDPSPGGGMVCGREWWYTALSRAATLCVTIGRWELMQLQARKPRLSRRQTFLCELIEEGMKGVTQS